jgi:hypothetical protein
MRKSATLLATVLLTAVAWVACTSDTTTSPTSPGLGGVSSSALFLQTGDHCNEFGPFDAKDEVGPPWRIDAPSGQLVAEVCVKAGNAAYYTDQNGVISVSGTPCFLVQGLGTSFVRVTLATGYVGNICKGISHITANFGPAPSPSPSPSPSASPSPYP